MNKKFFLAVIYSITIVGVFSTCTTVHLSLITPGDPFCEEFYTNSLISTLDLTPSPFVSSPSAPDIIPSSCEQPTIPLHHGLPQSQFDQLRSHHPKFVEKLLTIMDYPATQINWIIWASKSIIKNKLTQLTPEEAALFAQLQNSRGQTLEDLGKSTPELKKLYDETLAIFTYQLSTLLENSSK